MGIPRDKWLQGDQNTMAIVPLDFSGCCDSRELCDFKESARKKRRRTLGRFTNILTRLTIIRVSKSCLRLLIPRTFAFAIGHRSSHPSLTKENGHWWEEKRKTHTLRSSRGASGYDRAGRRDMSAEWRGKVTTISDLCSWTLTLVYVGWCYGGYHGDAVHVETAALDRNCRRACAEIYIKDINFYSRGRECGVGGTRAQASRALCAGAVKNELPSGFPALPLLPSLCSLCRGALIRRWRI